MSGVLEMLSGKADTLIEALTEHTKVMREFIAAGGSAGGGETGKKGPGRPKKDAEAAADKPKYSADQVKTKFEEIKAGDSAGRTPTLKKIIADQGVTTLAELLQEPTKFDAAYAALEAYEAELNAAPAADDDDDL